ncbi:MAG: hypothetical protein HY075_01945 [Deltaproteobacteria bacterium]|nr:hypothetical protein [Deltaproteobacteria bacterium]
MGPREVAQLADAAEDVARDVAGDTPKAKSSRIAEFLRKLCGLAAWCPGLQGLTGCPQ